MSEVVAVVENGHKKTEHWESNTGLYANEYNRDKSSMNRGIKFVIDALQ